uniref:Pancreatic progenitor cell differentiation and proliferation factor A-like n=1 Tax=Sinocyclocheilus grahami TaxID=75366 RepID=A0A672P3L4_SINGR
MAAIPSSGSLIATHDYYRRRIGSTSSNSSCGSSEYTGEVIPHPPGLARQDSGHWWSSFFFGKQNQMGTLNGFESHSKSRLRKFSCKIIKNQQHGINCVQKARKELSTLGS